MGCVNSVVPGEGENGEAYYSRKVDDPISHKNSTRKQRSVKRKQESVHSNGHARNVIKDEDEGFEEGMFDSYSRLMVSIADC